MKTIGEAMQSMAQALLGKSDTVGLDTQVLLAHVMQMNRAQIVAHPEYPLNAQQKKHIQHVLRKIAKNTPLPYIIGEWEFYNLSFKITPDVLIPRPETELLVEEALRWLKKHPARRRAADVGTGSGCIAITLAKHIPNLNVLATDISRAALRITRQNVQRHHVEQRVHLLQCDLLPIPPRHLPTSEKLDLIVGNPPYIPTETLRTLDVYHNEPTLALDGGPDGLQTIRRLLEIAPRWLAPQGLILLEIESTQGAQALSLAYDRFENARVRLLQDLSGRNRLLFIETRHKF